MKETLPAHQIPPAPPPPPPPPPAPDKVECGEKKRDLGLEGGEAPMDMDTKDDAENSSSSNAPGGDVCVCVYVGFLINVPLFLLFYP
jgi:hypothetical protein